MPQLANYSLKLVKETFLKYGIHVLEESDGIIIWGDLPRGVGLYKGEFTTSSEYLPGRYDTFTIQSVIEQLGKQDSKDDIMEYLQRNIFS